MTVTGMPGPSRRSAAARHAPRRTQPLPPVSRGAPWILSVGVSSASRGGGADRATPAGILGTGALRLHIHTQQQLLYLIDFLNILNFLAAISPWHQTSPNSQIKVEIWICKDRYLHQDNSDRQPGHDAICGDIGSVCNANYRCQIIIFITLGRGHYTSTLLLRSVSPLLIIVITVNMRPLLIYSGYTCYTDLHLHPSRLTSIQNI